MSWLPVLNGTLPWYNADAVLCLLQVSGLHNTLLVASRACKLSQTHQWRWGLSAQLAVGAFL